MKTIFVRLLNVEEKRSVLRDVVQAVINGQDVREGVFSADPEDFGQVPSAPFAYWVNGRILSLFTTLPSFGSRGREAQRALSTNDDFRYLRLWWERSKSVVAYQRPASGWFPFAKGGEYSPFYADIHLLVNWIDEGREIEADAIQKYPYLKGNAEWVLHRECNYLRPGLTWPLRTTSDLCLRAMPAGCIFGHKGPAAFVANDRPTDLLALLAIANSQAFRELVALQLAAADAAARSYEVGVLQRTPIPDLGPGDSEALSQRARRVWLLKHTLDTAELTSHAFVLPELLQPAAGGSLLDAARAWERLVAETEQTSSSVQAEIDKRCFDLYGFSAEDRKAATQAEDARDAATGQADNSNEAGTAASILDASTLAASLVDWLVGASFGRFDVRLATGERRSPPAPEPFDPLPTCSPGMLTDDCGLPARNTPEGYPLELPSCGVLVDDPGLDGDLPAPWDIVRRIRDVLTVVFGERALDIEAELCGLLGVRDLRGYIRRPAGFFADHLKRYSKSRRKAPIYWPLSTASGSYTVWIYYPRLSEDTLYTVIHEHVSPKIAEVDTRLVQLEHERGQTEGREATRVSKRLNDLAELLEELKTFRQNLQDVAALPYKPSLDDGVQISAAPLWRLFLHKPWRSELEKKIWRGLANAEYDWAHLAYGIWPERVREKCQTDRSLAIAHELESLYEGEH